VDTVAGGKWAIGRLPVPGLPVRKLDDHCGDAIGEIWQAGGVSAELQVAVRA
jgi:hypothetical protein